MSEIVLAYEEHYYMEYSYAQYMEYFNTWTLAFNRLVNDMFLFAKNSTLCNYADNNTQFSCKKHLIKY